MGASEPIASHCTLAFVKRFCSPLENAMLAPAGSGWREPALASCPFVLMVLTVIPFAELERLVTTTRVT